MGIFLEFVKRKPVQAPRSRPAKETGRDGLPAAPWPVCAWDRRTASGQFRSSRWSSFLCPASIRVVAKVDSGVPQGSLSSQLIVEFQKLGDTGDPASKSGAETDSNFRVRVQVNGRVIGPLSMILNERIKETAGSYIFDFGRITENDRLTATAFVVLKGNERNNTSLRIGEVYPDGVVKAKLGEPKGSGTMKLYPLEIELIPGTESVERQGKHKDDYGSIWIESDNDKVSKMRVSLKFSLDGR